MEYPLPSSFKGTPVIVPAFLSIPDLFQVMEMEVVASPGMPLGRFSSPEAFGDFVQQLSNVVDLGLSPVSLPPIIIENRNNRAESIVVFDSYMTRTAANYGLPEGVSILNGRDYLLALAQTENRPMFRGLLQIHLVENSENRTLIGNSIIIFRREAISQGISSRRIDFSGLLRAWDFSHDKVDITGIALDGFTGFEIQIPANQMMRITYFPGAVQTAPTMPLTGRA